ncbi:ShlB/FhaC/HecB family hemolysin secretion/activation protein [Bradyrhizobium sp. SZCCHNS2002]|uniref:ShlB/FhaC/HecB family hemolysin secretion/activation protein n=1 Tax=Bradyrhizobium sp. SZCCHNS2002 TaxID=3057302 RepID=UPI002915EDD0|nr:ShlB/FhaC/HecB family hemolysin secretion/activation protein [Bradyrhizobium sp. SZCCHNS2002]
MKSAAILVCCGVLSTTLISTQPAQAQTQAQTLPGIGDAVRQADETRKHAPSPQTNAEPVLPRLVDPPFTLNDHEKLLVRSIQVDGPKLTGEAELRAILAPYENRRLTLAEIYEAADKVTLLYRNSGYLVAKTYVPAQNARKGVLRFKIVVGKYGTITLKNESLVRDDFLRGVIDQALAASPFIHQDELERAMLLTSDLPGAGMPRVAIARGQQPETSDFVFGVPEARRVDGYLLADNFGSPYTGRDRLTGGINLNSPLGFGDRLSAFGIVTDDKHLLNGRIAYSAPLGYNGLRGEIAAYRTTYTLGSIYQSLNATGTADAFSAALTYPVLRGRDESIYISGGYTHKKLNDNVLGVSIADRNMDVGLLSVTRDTVGALAGLPLITSAMFSISGGTVDFPDPAQRAANLAGVHTAGDFAKINLNLNAVLAFTDKLSLATSVRAQKSLRGNLDSSEQLGLTGYYGVRSYDEGLAGDSGYLFTPELRYALPEIQSYRHSVGLFTDVGAVWLENPAFTTLQKGYTQLNAVGLGYYANYEYSPRRLVLLKAQVAHSYGSNAGAQTYDRGTKALVQIGVTF